LELLATLPASRQRDANELGLRTTLGTAWLALKGWAAPEVRSSLHPALALAKSLSRADTLLPILWGLWVNVLAQGRHRESLQWAEEMLTTARMTGDDDLLIAAHAVAASYFWIGELTKAREHADQVLTLYDEDKHRHLADILNQDPKTFVGIFAAHWTWMLGYPDQAVRISDDKDEHARRRGHPFDLGFALTFGADLFDYRCDSEALRKRAEEAERLGREHSMPFLSVCMAPIRCGMALIREGKAADGIVPLKAGLAFWDASGGKTYGPYLKSVLAEAMALLGDLDGALRLIDEQIAQIERPGWGERIHYAEILRLKGWIFSLKGDLQGAEKNYLASLDWARQQQAKSWELRTATSLARLWQGQGKRKKARDLLAPIYNWFTEGFDTKDLIEAKALLNELGE
jgi:predicted ATPase